MTLDRLGLYVNIVDQSSRSKGNKLIFTVCMHRVVINNRTIIYGIQCVCQSSGDICGQFRATLNYIFLLIADNDKLFCNSTVAEL